MKQLEIKLRRAEQPALGDTAKTGPDLGALQTYFAPFTEHVLGGGPEVGQPTPWDQQ
jgi:hypothetical protein